MAASAAGARFRRSARPGRARRRGRGTNVHVAVGHPYGNATWRQPMSTGRRIALEVKRAAQLGRLADVVT